MLSTKTILNIVLLVIVVILIVVLKYKPGQEPLDAHRITKIDPNTIEHIRLERIGADPIEFARQDKQWVMIAPYKIGAIQINVESLLDLLQYNFIEKYSTANLELKKYDLDIPRAVIIYNRQHRFEFGKTESLNKLRYLKFNDNMFLTEDYFHHRILGAATSFIHTRLIAKDQVIEQIKLPGMDLKYDNGNWQLTPQSMKALNDQLNHLADNWKHAHAIGITTYQDIVTQGQVELIFKGDPQPLVLQIVNQDKKFYLARTDYKIMYRLANEKRRYLLQLPPPIDIKQLEKDTGKNP